MQQESSITTITLAPNFPALTPPTARAKLRTMSTPTIQASDELALPGLDLADAAFPEDAVVAAMAAKGRAPRKRWEPKDGINYLHEALADYLLMNPGATLRELGGHFGYTIAWLCTVINSDMFTAYLAERRAEVKELVHQSLPKRLEAAAHLATERIMEVLETTNDGEMIVDAFDKIMQRYGYAPGKGALQQTATVTNQTNIFYLSPEQLARSKEKFIEAHATQVPALPITVEGTKVEPEG